MVDQPACEQLEQLQQRVRELEKAEYEASAQRDHAKHLRNILLAIRNVHQLIVRETDPKKLVKKVCSQLIDTRGYFNAWIALMDEKGDIVETSTVSGFNGGFDIMESDLHQGDFPLCMRCSLDKDELTVIRNPPADCPDCPLSSEYEGRSGLSCRLSYRDRVFGILSVSVREEIKKRVLDDCVGNDPERMQWEDVPVSRSGKKPFYITAKNIPLPERNLVVSTLWDVTERKRSQT